MTINVFLLITSYPTVIFLPENLSFSVDFHRFCKWPIMSYVNKDTEVTSSCSCCCLFLFYSWSWSCNEIMAVVMTSTPALFLAGFFQLYVWHLCWLFFKSIIYSWVCCCSVAKLCLTLCDPVNCSTPGFPVLHYLPEFAQWCHPTVSSSVAPLNSCPQSFQHQNLPLSWLLASASWRIGASDSAPVLPMNIQDWFPLGWTGWISLQSKGLSRVFSNTTVQKHQFFGAQFSL